MGYFNVRLSTEFVNSEIDEPSISMIEGGLDILTEHGRVYLQLSDKQKESIIALLQADLQDKGK